jgi:hypothetical protein
VFIPLKKKGSNPGTKTKLYNNNLNEVKKKIPSKTPKALLFLKQ